MGHVLMENRNGLAVAGDVTRATGTAERETALDLIDSHARQAADHSGRRQGLTTSRASCTTCASARSRPTSPSTAI